MSNVDLHMTPASPCTCATCVAGSSRRRSRDVPYLDDTASYTVTVDSGVVAIDLASLNALMTQTLADDNSNVDKLKISVDDKGNLRQKGVIDKAVNIPFNVKAGIEATPDGKLRVFTKSVKGFGVPMKPLMKMFHIEMDDLLKVKPGHGVDRARQRPDSRSGDAAAGAVDSRRDHQRAHRRQCGRADLRRRRGASPVAAAGRRATTSTGAADRWRSAS